MDNRVRVGFVGCGEAIQALHIPAVNSLASLYRISACSDSSAEVMQEVSTRTGARAISNPLDLIDDPNVDVVVIATPDSYHADFALAACKAKKKAVLVEKPMTLNARMGREISLASESSGVPVIVGYPHVYDPATRRAMELWGQNQSFRFGQFRTFLGPNPKYTADDILQTIRPSATDRWPGLINQLSLVAACTEVLGTAVEIKHVAGHMVLLGLVIHDIPVMRRFCGEPVKVDYAAVRCQGIPTSELGIGVDVMFDYGYGRVFMQAEFEQMKVTDWGFKLHRDDMHVEVKFPPTYAAAAPSTCRTIYERDGMTVEETHGGRYENGFRCEWKHIHDVVTKRVEPLTSARDAVKDLELVETIIKVATKDSK
ncbi:Gfo/Idh/MocA family oxidoreductase [Candidatus Poribacteria bacterium]|nr:Gfo/Idh/MocA family oxidoreductase [Candidatus Poribacteria bacterium]